jgi:hypothetical protein
MIERKTSNRIYVALALAAVAATISVVYRPAPLRELARFLVAASDSEAAVTAAAIGEDPNAIAPR